MLNTKRPPFVISFPAAFVAYTIFAAWLFYPYKQNFSAMQFIWPAQTIIAATGVFVISRRWVLSFFASLAGGAVYGFGTYACSLLCYHPFAGIVYAILPWTFVPAVFLYQWINLDRLHTSILSALLVLLTVFFILAAYHFAAAKYFYPIPVQTRLSAKALFGIIDPLGVKQDIFAPGLYHVCMAGLLMGIAVLIKTKRIGMIILFAVTTAAAFYKPVLNVPPVVWASIPVLICSIMIASGLETIVLAGAADGKWLLCSVALLLLLSIADVFLAHQTEIIPLSAALYGIGVVAVLFIYFIAEANIAWHPVRMFILYSAVFLDILISTKRNIDMIF